MEAELIVVDNNSPDNSLAYLQPQFPGVHFIASAENLGFAKACNLGLQQAIGQYILFLNPDTIVPEDCFRSCIHFLKPTRRLVHLALKCWMEKGSFSKNPNGLFLHR